MSLEDYINKKGFSIKKEEDRLRINMGDYEFYIDNLSIIFPVPLPTGNESLDDLVNMGIKYARASRLVQGLGSPVEYTINGSELDIIKKFNNREDLERKLIKSMEGIESLRYFL
ncbi:hypothetical protein [Acidianus brierleyi]|uniref:Uncharacterized protein n=1 Tax=Acidianus brierleyi TaxID=41673 RepID=A0A2U9IGC5_9CREN|nr:hypothetical protein [Acidianus brierleyi]AWR95112.1 hypothetical protein DFR85_11400 [Acidianus brierleyi]